MNLLELFSVGCVIDSKTAIVYPQNMDGSPDLSLPINLKQDEVSAEWYESLSQEDYKIVKQIKK